MNAQLVHFIALLRRYPLAAVCSLLILGSGAGAYFLSGDIDQQEAARIDRAKEGESMLELLVGGSMQRAELDAVREATHRIDENLIIEANLADNSWYFYKLEDQTKARVLELHPGSSSTMEGAALYRRVPYTLRISGTYEQVASYLLAIETGPRLANITAFGLGRRDKEGAGVTLELTLELLGKK